MTTSAGGSLRISFAARRWVKVGPSSPRSRRYETQPSKPHTVTPPSSSTRRRCRSSTPNASMYGSEAWVPRTRSFGGRTRSSVSSHEVCRSPRQSTTSRSCWAAIAPASAWNGRSARARARIGYPHACTMCRLFGLHGGRERVRACFWLLEAPRSLALQSRCQPDGYGIGAFGDDGRPHVERGVTPAWQDDAFARDAKQECSPTYVVHLRYASSGPAALRNSHPFMQDGRLIAHNGVFEGLGELEEHLGPYRALVHGDTDSERFFALIPRETRLPGGDL